MSTYSPMLEQYFGMKARFPEAILLSRVGDFYEAYGDDAETIARALSIALTSKESGGGKRVAMAGVPYHALDTYLAKLVAQRRVVALAEQLEVPQPNKLVRRDVTRVVTPGTVIEENLLERGTHNFLAALTLHGETVALAHADISTGYCAATTFAGETGLEDALAEIERIGPAEIVADVPPNVRETIARALEPSGDAVRITTSPLAALGPIPSELFAGTSAEESLALHRALDALAAFVRRVRVGSSAILRAPEIYSLREFVALDPNTRKHLELSKALGANAKATLLATIDRARTAMGSRMLSRWVNAPLVSAQTIATRADAVETLVGEGGRRSSLQDLLDGCFDLERIAQKVRFRRATPRDLASLRRTLAYLDPIVESLPQALAHYAGRIGEFSTLARDLAATLVDDPPATLVEGGAIRPESNADLAECCSLRTDARSRLSALEERERERTGIKSLKVKYSSAFGYALEVSKSNVGAVPSDYVRRQTLANGERYVTTELRELDAAIASAQTRQYRLEQSLYDDLLERVALHVEALLATAEALAELDVYCSLAQIAAERGYVRPRFIGESCLRIREGRHPVMEALLGNAFVPNDLALETGRSRFILLTGPNMGGKSTYLRQTALLVILAQIGSFVPAAEMELGVIERIFTRIGAGDDLASGQSTFYVEMNETAGILRRATQRSLLLIDEVGRGTGTIDGLAIAQSISEFLLERETQSPFVLFATHFHELVALSERWSMVENFHITAVESGTHGVPVFSHRVLPGSSSRSFGIEVARMAGLPPSVVARAKEISDALEGRPTLEVQVPLRGRLSRADGGAEQQLALGL
jgi:DNA mismatch repair protein MutS